MPLISDTIWYVFLFLTYFPSVSQSLVPSMLLQRASFHSFLLSSRRYTGGTSFLIYSSVYAHWGYFHVLAIFNSTAMNISPGIIFKLYWYTALSHNLKVGPKNQCFEKAPQIWKHFPEITADYKIHLTINQIVLYNFSSTKALYKNELFLEWLMILLSI